MSESVLKMADVIPEGKSGIFEIEHKVVSEHEAKMEEIRWMFKGMGGYTHEAGRVAILKQNSGYSKVMMSDTPMERESNYRIMARANGNVLVGGLGLGMIIVPMLENPRVNKVLVVEKQKEIIELVYPHIKKLDRGNKLSVVNDDIFLFDPEPDIKFDTIYFDIWNGICGDNWDEIKMLKRKFRKHLNKTNTDAFIGAWMEEEVKRL